MVHHGPVDKCLLLPTWGRRCPPVPGGPARGKSAYSCISGWQLCPSGSWAEIGKSFYFRTVAGGLEGEQQSLSRYTLSENYTPFRRIYLHALI